jgi:uncharacterized protein Usg
MAKVMYVWRRYPLAPSQQQAMAKVMYVWRRYTLA